VARRVPTDGAEGLRQNPFGALDAGVLGLPSKPASAAAPQAQAPERNRGRVDITREKAGRGGKTVTVVGGFSGIGLPEKEELARKMRAACGCGGTVKEGRIEIQGDQRGTVARILSDAGFHPVYAGG